MPGAPYVIDGVVYSISSTTPSALATVKMINVTTGDTLNLVTNALGQYVADINNFKSGYSNGDIIFITASDGTYHLQWRVTVNTGVGSETINLTLLNDEKSQGREEFDTYAMRYSNVNNIITTTMTPLVSPYDSGLFRTTSITIDNSSAQTLTTKVWVSDKKQPGAVGGADWAQLGSDISNTTLTKTAKEWTGKYKWTAVTGTATTTTATVSIHIYASS